MWLSIWGGGGVHWVAGGAGCGGFCCPFVVCSVAFFLPFVRFPAFAPDVLGLNMPLFAILRRFLAGFRVLVYICMGLVLCVACVAFVCVSG